MSTDFYVSDVVQTATDTLLDMTGVKAFRPSEAVTTKYERVLDTTTGIGTTYDTEVLNEDSAEVVTELGVRYETTPNVVARYLGDGVEDTFDCITPLASNEVYMVYVNKTLKTITTHYTVDGTEITFTGGNIPASGAIITVYIRGWFRKEYYEEGDGIETDFVVPAETYVALETYESYRVYLDDVLKTITTHYTVSDDTITFLTEPGEGEVVKIEKYQAGTKVFTMDAAAGTPSVQTSGNWSSSGNDTLTVYVEEVEQTITTDYTVDGDEITFVDGSIPADGDNVTATLTWVPDTYTMENYSELRGDDVLVVRANGTALTGGGTDYTNTAGVLVFEAGAQPDDEVYLITAQTGYSVVLAAGSITAIGNDPENRDLSTIDFLLPATDAKTIELMKG
jgi:hypothetical protein